LIPWAIRTSSIFIPEKSLCKLWLLSTLGPPTISKRTKTRRNSPNRRTIRRQRGIETEEKKNIRLAPRRAREQAKREQAQRDQEKELAAAAIPKIKKKGATLGKAQQELGAQQRQAKAKVTGGVVKGAKEPLCLDTTKVSSFPPTS
jgi:hypothetical protein